MVANNQISIAAHLMACLGYCTETERTSVQPAASVNTSPNFIRRTLAKLSKAGLIVTAKSEHRFCHLGKQPTEVFLFDIYHAVEVPKAISIRFYGKPNPAR